MNAMQKISDSRRRKVRRARRQYEGDMRMLDGLYWFLVVLVVVFTIYAYQSYGVEAALITLILWVPGLLIEYDNQRRFKKRGGRTTPRLDGNENI